MSIERDRERARASKERQRQDRLRRLLEANPTEEWRSIDIAPEYFVSQYGRLRRGPYLLHGSISPWGYLEVRINKHVYKVHRLVTMAFLGPIPEGQEVRHLNDIKTDNRLANLAYGTHSQNMLDRVTNGHHSQMLQTECKHGHPFDELNTNWVLQDTGRPRRQCRACARRRSLEYAQRKRAAA